MRSTFPAPYKYFPQFVHARPSPHISACILLQVLQTSVYETFQSKIYNRNCFQFLALGARATVGVVSLYRSFSDTDYISYNN